VRKLVVGDNEFNKELRKKNAVMQRHYSPPSTTSGPMPSQSLSNSYFGKPPVFIWQGIWHGISLWPILVSRPSNIPPSSSLLPTPSPTHYRGRTRNRESLGAVQHCSARVNTLVCYQHRSSHKSKTEHHTLAAMKKMNSIPVGPSTTFIF